MESGPNVVDVGRVIVVGIPIVVAIAKVNGALLIQRYTLFKSDQLKFKLLYQAYYFRQLRTFQFS